MKVKLSKNAVTAILCALAVVPGALVAISIIWILGAYIFGLALSWDQLVFGPVPIEDTPDRTIVVSIRLVGGMFGPIFSVAGVAMARI